jgi:hypothetical protein
VLRKSPQEISQLVVGRRETENRVPHPLKKKFLIKEKEKSPRRSLLSIAFSLLTIDVELNVSEPEV